MHGIVKTVTERNYGFIKASNGGEYFFHKADFNGFWEDLVKDFRRMKIEVTFEVAESPKGPRAAGVRRLDYPN